MTKPVTSETAELQKTIANLVALATAEFRRLMALQGQPQWVVDAVNAEPRGFMADLVAHRRSNSASMIPPDQRSEEPRRPSGGGTVELKSPSGIEHCDRMMDQQDRIDRAAAIQRALDAAWADRVMEKSRVATEYNPFDREHMEK